MVSIKTNFDFNNLYEYPQMELCNPNKHEICIMTNVKELKFTLRCNDVSEASFRVYKTMNDVDFPEYNLIRKMRLVHFDGIGYFVIQEVSEIFEEMIPYKDVTLYSAEYMLNYKPVNLCLTTMVDGGTTVFAKSYKFYDKDYPNDTLMYRLFAGADFKDWTFDYDSIDESLMKKYRSFDDSGDGLYGFLQNYVSTSYECVFTYDIENYIVSVHKKDDLIRPTDITLSMDNLMKQANLKELSDEISTVLAVKGSDKLSLSKVNPTGTDNIYNFDYYLKEEWIGDDFVVSSVKYDSNGNVVYGSNGKPVTVNITFTEHVKLWEQKIRQIITDATTEGSYGWLLKRYTYLNAQYILINTYHTYAEYIYNYCTEAISTYQDDTKKQKKSIWGTILFGIGLAVVAVGAVALAGITGGGSLAMGGAAVSAMLAGDASALGTAIGISKLGATLVGLAATTTINAGISTAFQGLMSLGAMTYQTNITKDQMKKYQKVAQNNMDVYKSGGDYVYELTPETLTNLVSGRTKEFVVDNPLFWISKTYDESNVGTICQKRPNDDGVKATVPQNYCLDVLNQKLNYIQDKLDQYVNIYAYKNWFSTLEQEALQPFLIQSEYSDESFTATDDIDIESATDTTKYVTTNQGTMTIEEYRCATDGHMIQYLCKGDTKDYEANPITFNETTFRNWIVNYPKWASYKNDKKSIRGHFYMSFDGTYWTISDNDSGSIINQIYDSSKFPTQLGVEQNTYNGKYKYTPKSGDYIMLNIYSEKIELMDTLTVATQLAQQGYEVLDECSQPAFSFDITSNNFLFLPEYKEWTEQLGFDGDGLTLGSMINVMYVDDQVLNPFVQEVSFEYDNPDSLSFTFGNKFNLGTSEYTLGKVFSDNTSTVQRVQRALIGTSTTNGSGSTGGRNYRNNSSAIASTNDAIDDMQTFINEKVVKEAEENAKKFNNAIKEANDRLDGIINNDLADLKTDLEEVKKETEDMGTKIANNTKDFATTIGGGLGLHITPITDDTGTRYCFHNGDTMASSYIYYYLTSSGFAWASFYTKRMISFFPPRFEDVPVYGRLDKNSIKTFDEWKYGMTGDGDMVMRQLTVDKITANQIAADSILAQHIKADQITGDKIKANTITGSKIHGETIYASNLREDAWCMLVWQGTYNNLTTDTIRTSGEKDLNRFTAVMVYTSTGDGSTMVIRGATSSMVSRVPHTLSSRDSGHYLGGKKWYEGHYNTFASRSVTFGNDDNGSYVYFQRCYMLEFGIQPADNTYKGTDFNGLKFSGALDDRVITGMYPKFSEASDRNLPSKIYGLRFGVRASDEVRDD